MIKTTQGRITIDDIVDLIKDEAEEDYLLAAGISNDVEADDSIFELTKARLPWLILGLFGGLGSVFILESYESIMSTKLKSIILLHSTNRCNGWKCWSTIISNCCSRFGK